MLYSSVNETNRAPEFAVHGRFATMVSVLSADSKSAMMEARFI